MGGVSGWIEAYKPHINPFFRSSNTLDPHFAGTNLVNLSVPTIGNYLDEIQGFYNSFSI